ncbi:HAD-IB family hydrolase [Neisseriaceae bacterium ESL0693]|nr:HAD-IB family hydrolase [Neisseriaceae bacterium ESL0693]
MTKPPVAVLSVFDFDGTLTKHDSFIPFLRFAFGNRIFSLRMMRMVIPAIRFWCGQISRDELKQILIATFLTGVKADWLMNQAQQFCQHAWPDLMRLSGIEGVEHEIRSGAEVTLCSASPALVLEPFAERLGIKLIATELEVIDGRLTGRIQGHNCRCIQKIKRLEQKYGALNQYHLRAWGDSRGDQELLAAANEPHWRYFHKK